MKSSLTSTLVLGAALVASLSSANASVALGSDARLFGTLDARAKYNDNLFLSAPRSSDTIFEAAPGLALEFGQSALFRGHAYYNETFQFYSDHSNLNTSLSSVGAAGTYDDDKNKLDLKGSFVQANQATRDVRTTDVLVRRELTDLAAIDELRITEKTAVSAGVVYSDTDYKRAGYTDYQHIAVPVKYYYQVLPKLDLAAGYTFRSNNLGGTGIDSDEDFVNVGVRGEVSPKLTGELAVGYTTLRPDRGFKNQHALGLDAGFVYAVTPKTNVRFGGKNGYSYSATGEANRIGGLNVGVNAQVAADWRVDGSLVYNRFSYINSNRADDFYVAQLGATYLVSEAISVTGAYSYSNNDSNLKGASFTDNILSVAASFKY